MQRTIAIGVACLIAFPAWAGRAVTDAERVKLVEAVAATGCSGGKMEWDSPHFEVDEAKCADGKLYDLKFDQDFKLVGKKLEN
jgi:hypothetical protein